MYTQIQKNFGFIYRYMQKLCINIWIYAERSCIDVWIYIANCINLYIEDEQTNLNRTKV